MVKTEKAEIYHNVKILAHRYHIDLYEFKRYKKGSKTYWKKVLIKLKTKMLELLFLKKKVLYALPHSIELLIYQY